MRVRQSGGGGDCDRLSGPVLGGLREQRGADQNWSILLIVVTFHPCPWFPTVTSDKLRIPQIFDNYLENDQIDFVVTVFKNSD